MRILRALRTIPRVPKLKVLVITIVDSTPYLAGAAVLLGFLFVVFGIMGVQLFKGHFRYQCGISDNDFNVFNRTEYRVLDTEYIAYCNPRNKDGTDDPFGRVYMGNYWRQDGFKKRQECRYFIGCQDGQLPPSNDFDYCGTNPNPPNILCQDAGKNPFKVGHFDDIGNAMLMVFQIVTLQDWSRIMYDLSRSDTYRVSLYFVPLIFIVTFFAVNLILAVIVYQYGKSVTQVQIEEDYDDTLNEMDELIQQKSTKKSQPVKNQITYENYRRKMRSLKAKVIEFEQNFKEYNQGPVENANRKHELQRKTKIRFNTERGGKKGKNDKNSRQDLAFLATDIEDQANKSDDDDFDDLKDETWTFTKRAVNQQNTRRQMIADMMINFNRDLAFEIWILAKPIYDEHREKVEKNIVLKWIHWIATAQWFEKIIILIILINTIILAIWWPGMPEDLITVEKIANIIFTVIFVLELIIKLIGLGWKRWKFDGFNIFDAVVVIVSVVELFFSDDNTSGAITAFRALRVLRVIRLLHQIPGLRLLLNSVLQSFEPVFFLSIIFILFIFMFGVLGVQLYAGQIFNLKTNNFLLFSRPWRFDTLNYAMVTFVQIFSSNGWPRIMQDMVVATDSTASAFLMCISVFIGLYLFKNMFLAILINRMANQDNIQVMIDDLISKARQKQRNFDSEKGFKLFEEDVKELRRQRIVSSTKHQARIDKIEERAKIKGTSFGIFTKTNPFRIRIHYIVEHIYFEMTINFLIIVNCVFLALNNFHVTSKSDLGVALKALDWVFTSIFFIEMIIKMIAYGVYDSGKFPWSKHYKAKEKKLEREKKLRRKKRKEKNNNDKNNNGTIIQPDVDDEEKKDENDMNNNNSDKTKDDEYYETCENAYLRSNWNRLDAFIVIVAILGLFTQSGFLRGLRAIRPIRVALRVGKIKVVVKALLASLPNILNAVAFSLFFLLVVSIVGLHVFSGQFGRCVEYAEAFDVVDVEIAERKIECIPNDPRALEWVETQFNFNNIGSALLTVYKISTLSSWFDELAAGYAGNINSFSVYSSPEGPYQAVPFKRPASALYFILVVVLGGFFLLNIIISVVVDSFNRIKNSEDNNALLTSEQVVWVRKRRFLSRFPLKNDLRPPKQTWRHSFHSLVTHPWFEPVILTFILINTVVLMSDHYDQPESWETAAQIIEIIFVVIYAFEAIFKILGLGTKTYFRDPWNIFDFVIVIVSIIGLAFDEGAFGATFRLLRVARVIRVIKRAPSLRALFMTLVYAIPSLINIGLLLVVIFFIWGIIGVELFGKTVPNDGYGNPIIYDSNDGISPSVNFEYFTNALMILYRIATNDNWGAIFQAAAYNGNKCDTLISNNTKPSDGAFDYQCGKPVAAVFFFISFGIFGTIVMLNLFIAVILDTYMDTNAFEAKMEKLDCIEEWISVWKESETKHLKKKKLKGRLGVKKFVKTFKKSPKLVGLMLDSLSLRLNIEDEEMEINYNNPDQLKRKSIDAYNKIDFVGKANKLDEEVEVTNDHINAIMKTRRLRILCKYRHHGGVNEEMVVYYDDALFAIVSLIVGPEFRLFPYDNNKAVHISDWWSEKIDDMDNISF